MIFARKIFKVFFPIKILQKQMSLPNVPFVLLRENVKFKNKKIKIYTVIKMLKSTAFKNTTLKQLWFPLSVLFSLSLE